MRRWRFAVGLVAGVLVVAAPSASATPTWSVAPSPTPSGSTHGEISAVSCPSTTSCFAVGRYDTPSSSGILVEHWNGSHWSSMAGPKPAGSSFPALVGVSCPNPTSCFAVGSYGVPGILKPLAERWNGSHWSIMTSPNTGSPGTILTGVSCPSPTSCFAVGSYDVSGTEKSLVEHWNGSAWGVMTRPNPTGATTSYLVGVSCPSPNSCFAVGSYQTTGGAEKSLLERWDGSTWGVMNSPNRELRHPARGVVSGHGELLCRRLLRQQLPGGQGSGGALGSWEPLVDHDQLQSVNRHRAGRRVVSDSDELRRRRPLLHRLSHLRSCRAEQLIGEFGPVGLNPLPNRMRFPRTREPGRTYCAELSDVSPA